VPGMDVLINSITEQWDGMCTAGDPNAYFRTRISTARLLPTINKDYEDLCPNLQSLFRLGTNHSAVELFVRPFDYWTRPLLPRVADLFVGLILREPDYLDSVKITVNGVVVNVLHSLVRGEPAIVCNDYVIPTLVSGLHTTVGLPGNAQVDLVMANVGDAYKTSLSGTVLCHPNRNGTWLVYHDKTCRITSNTPHGAVSIPPLTPWKYMAMRKRQLMRNIEEELICKTWHPLRVESGWCLDSDDLHLIESE